MSATYPARDFIGYGRKPPVCPWPNDATLAISVGINYEEGAENFLPDNGRRESVGEVTSSVPLDQRDVWNESFFEYGSRVGVWRLLRLMAAHDVPATFFLSALAGERNPDVAKAIVDEGHEASGHGYRWTEYHELTQEERRQDIQKCVETITRLTGERPVGWLNRYAATVDTRELLVNEGNFLYDNNAYNDDIPYYSPVGPDRKPFLVLPYSMELNDARAWRGAMLSPGDYQDFLFRAFDQLYADSQAVAPRMMSIGLHCRISGTPGRVASVENFLKYAKGHDGVWFARRDQIARWWMDKMPASNFEL
jgi:peptidoglycan/xylan/chitin deacetylase (PgdA/CDA1 family)